MDVRLTALDGGCHPLFACRVAMWVPARRCLGARAIGVALALGGAAGGRNGGGLRLVWAAESRRPADDAVALGA